MTFYDTLPTNGVKYIANFGTNNMQSILELFLIFLSFFPLKTNTQMENEAIVGFKIMHIIKLLQKNKVILIILYS